MESWSYSLHRLWKIHAMESRKYLQRVGPTSRHSMVQGRRQWLWKTTQPPHGTRECHISTPSWERNSSSSGICPFKMFLKNWSRCSRNKQTIWWLQETLCSETLWWTPIPYFSLLENLKEDCTIVHNSLFLSGKNMLPIQCRKLKEGSSKLEIKHILTVMLINSCSEP